MRTLAELPHPEFKISIFEMNQKFIVKFEQGVLEQTYKIPETDVVDGVNGVFEMLDEKFLKDIENHFKEMRGTFIEMYNRCN